MKLWTPKKLSLACGKRKPEGYVGIDIDAASDADIIADLLKPPWPIKDNSAEQVSIEHFVEHIPHWRPWFDRDGWYIFWNEVYRVCRDGASVEVTHPYHKSDRAYWDPTHERFINEGTWAYLDKRWRERELIDPPEIACDFDCEAPIMIGLSTEQMTRSREYQEFAAQHYWNAFPDLKVVLRARK